MKEVKEFFTELIPVLKAKDYKKLDELVSSYEHSSELEVLYYIWLLFHPECNPYMDDDLNDVYSEIKDIDRANKFGKLCFDGYRALCEQGKSEYMRRLGELYLDGCGCEINKSMADYWFKKAKGAD